MERSYVQYPSKSQYRVSPKVRQYGNGQADGQSLHKKLPKLSDAIEKLNNSPRHILYNEMLSNPDVNVTIAIGPAGVGKTLMPSTHAIHHLLQKDIKKVIITRPHVNMGDDLGYLPGGKNEKMQPWLIPIYDSFKEYITVDRLKEYLRNEDIEICPFNFMRGRTFHDSWIIADEVQNTTVIQMKALMTRIGNNSKMCLTGDLQQCDLVEENGLNDFIHRLHMYSNIVSIDQQYPIQMVQFTDEDVMRSDIVKEILGIYDM